MRATLFLITVLVATHLSANNGAKEKKPNVIIIMTDDQGSADEIWANHNDEDKVAAAGKKLTDLSNYLQVDQAILHLIFSYDQFL
ncbi:MAG: hypothetical protein GY790_09930 [Bacteroidetes bacterium]|nr:hypothetical protein [Bacteroidota bacterium]